MFLRLVVALHYMMQHYGGGVTTQGRGSGELCPPLGRVGRLPHYSGAKSTLIVA